MAVVDHGRGKDGGGDIRRGRGGGGYHLYLFFRFLKLKERKKEERDEIRAVKSQLHMMAFGRLIYYTQESVG